MTRHSAPDQTHSGGRGGPTGQGRQVRPWRFWGRVTLFAIIIVAAGATAYELWPKPQTAPGAYDQKVTITMAGFSPADISLASGKPSMLWLVNPDSSHHTDGGGVHGFTVPDLNIDVRVQPESNLLMPISASPGEYAFYCDTCCGGKENPAMRGILRIGGGT